MLALMPIPKVYNQDDGAWDPGRSYEDLEDEMRFWPRIVFIDAGTQSGITVIWFHPVRLMDPRVALARAILAHWSSYAGGNENGQAQEILRLCRGLGGESGLCVGLEKFVVQRVSGEETFLSSPRIAAKVEFGLWAGIRDHDDVIRRRGVVWQMPGEAKSEPDSRLRVLRLYREGPDHINDATKHAWLHLKKMRNGGLGQLQKLYGWNEEWRQ